MHVICKCSEIYCVKTFLGFEVCAFFFIKADKILLKIYILQILKYPITYTIQIFWHPNKITFNIMNKRSYSFRYYIDLRLILSYELKSTVALIECKPQKLVFDFCAETIFHRAGTTCLMYERILIYLQLLTLLQVALSFTTCDKRTLRFPRRLYSLPSLVLYWKKTYYFLPRNQQVSGLLPHFKQNRRYCKLQNMSTCWIW